MSPGSLVWDPTNNLRCSPLKLNYLWEKGGKLCQSSNPSGLFIRKGHVDFSPKIFHCKKHQCLFSSHTMWTTWSMGYILLIFVSAVSTTDVLSFWWMNKNSAMSDLYLKWIVAFKYFQSIWWCVLGRLTISLSLCSCQTTSTGMNPLASIKRSILPCLYLSLCFLSWIRRDLSYCQDWDRRPKMPGVPSSGLSFHLVCEILQNRGLIFSTPSSIWEACLIKGSRICLLKADQEVHFCAHSFEAWS